MNKYTVFISFLLCLVIVNARHYGDRSDSESASEDRNEQIDNYKRPRHSGSLIRNRRRNYHTNHGYEYQQPAYPYYPDNRREYEQNQQDLIPQIFKLLDEISAFVRHPPPPQPAQPIYIPYPMPYPVPQPCNCLIRRFRPVTQGTNPNITGRFPSMEDTNQNWGFVDYPPLYVDDSDGSRPISFETFRPQRPLTRPAPKLDHGTNQAGNSLQSPVMIPGKCDLISLTCCHNNSPEKQIQCFNENGCSSTYDNGNGCAEKKMLAIIDAFSKAYAVIN